MYHTFEAVSVCVAAVLQQCCSSVAAIVHSAATVRFTPFSGVIYSSVLQCVAVCCSVLQCAAGRSNMLPCGAVCCRVVQCVAVCSNVLRCVAVCCSASLGVAKVYLFCTGVLQCTAVCCNVPQYIALAPIYQAVTPNSHPLLRSYNL